MARQRQIARPRSVGNRVQLIRGHIGLSRVAGAKQLQPVKAGVRRNRYAGEPIRLLRHVGRGRIILANHAKISPNAQSRAPRRFIHTGRNGIIKTSQYIGAVGMGQHARHLLDKDLVRCVHLQRPGRIDGQIQHSQRRRQPHIGHAGLRADVIAHIADAPIPLVVQMLHG